MGKQSSNRPGTCYMASGGKLNIGDYYTSPCILRRQREFNKYVLGECKTHQG